MTRTVRAVVMPAPGAPLVVDELPLPEMPPGGALVRVELMGLCGSDYYVKYSPAEYAREHEAYEKLGGRAPFKPYVIGHELLGIVEEVGPELKPDVLGRRIQPGDRIAAHISQLVQSNPAAPHFVGPAAERIVTSPNAMIARVDPTVPPRAALLASCAFRTVFHALDELGGAIRLGSDIVIQGVGSLGLTSIIAARENGAGKIIAIDTRHDRLKLAAEYGADELIDIREVSTPEDRIAQVREMTGGLGVDIAIECSGARTAVAEAIGMLKRGGTALLIGKPRVPELISTGALVLQGKRLIGVTSSQAPHLAASVKLLERTHQRYAYEKIVSHTFPLDQANAACDAARTGTAIKVALDPWLG